MKKCPFDYIYDFLEYWEKRRISVTLGIMLLVILCPPLQIPMIILFTLIPLALLITWASGWVFGEAGAGFVALVLFVLVAYSVAYALIREFSALS